MKVIFLDHDGVICLADQWGGRYKKKGYDNNPETPMDIRMDSFDKKAVNVLNKIIDKSGCEIVISSDWKRWGTLEQIQEMYRTRGIKEPIGLTPFFSDLLKEKKVPLAAEFTMSDSLEIERHYEILDWLKNHPEVTHWVSVDDLDMSKRDWWGLENFVLCKRPHREGIKQCGLKDKILEYLL